MEQERSRYQCVAHGCNLMATIDSVCWFHDASSPADWGNVTAGIHNHPGHLRLIYLILPTDGRQKLEAKHQSLEMAAQKAAEGLDDQDLQPKESDYIKTWTNRDGTQSECHKFDWYAYGTRVRGHLLQVCKRKRQVRRWDQELEAA